MNKSKALLLVCSTLMALTNFSYSYEGVTHGGITNQAEKTYSILDDYLKLLGFAAGKDKTFFALQFQNPGNCPIVHDESLNGANCFVPDDADLRDDFLKHGEEKVFDDFGGDIVLNMTTHNVSSPWCLPYYGCVPKRVLERDSQTAFEWLQIGSSFEDNPIIRAAHHFHDPVSGRGLNEKEKCPPTTNIDFVKYKSGGEFSCFGDSAFHRAFHLVSPPSTLNTQGQYANFFYSWDDGERILRNYQYLALTGSLKVTRSHYWALTLYGLGSTIHLLEDMGVPEHVRNYYETLS